MITQKNKTARLPPHTFNQVIKGKTSKVGVPLLTCGMFFNRSQHQGIGANLLNSSNTGWVVWAAIFGDTECFISVTGKYRAPQWVDLCGEKFPV